MLSRCTHLRLLAAVYYLHASPNLVTSVGAAIANPGFWDATQEQLDALVERSRPYFRPVAEMAGRAKLCNSLPGYEEETAYKLTNVTVIVMDDALICRDFPSTCDLSSDEKERWVVDKAGWFSAHHIAAGVNNDIPYDARRSVPARRACAGGRALLFPTAGTDADIVACGKEEEGAVHNCGAPPFLDVKGVGARDPTTMSSFREEGGSAPRDGLLSLFDALYEYMNEKTVSAILEDHSRRHPNDEEQAFHTVGIYAVVSLGFHLPVKTKEGTKYLVASGLVRQASRRHPNPHGWMDYQEAAVLEQILNAYGIRSDGPTTNIFFARLPNPTCRRINLQGTMVPRTLTDFGPFQADMSQSWPPTDEEDACLVHWGETARIIDAILWGEEGIGSSRVREFLKEEYKPLPRATTEGRPVLEYEHVRLANNARMHSMWEIEVCWWNGQCSIEEVRKSIQTGLIDAILLDEKKNEDVCEAGQA